MNARTNRLQTGVENLDVVLGGGMAEGDLLLVVGAPGSGKTTLAFQVAFHAACSGKPVVYVSTLSEPASRLVKHLRTFEFWDDRLVGKRLFLQSIFPIVREGVGELVDALLETVKAREAGMLVVDGFMTIRDLHPQSLELRTFVNEVAVAMGPLGCTTILTSSSIPNMRADTPPEFTMCDAIIELAQEEIGARAVRTLRAWKTRGAAGLLGRNAMRITERGIVVYPRIEGLPLAEPVAFDSARLSFGTPELDEMMSGGPRRATVTILAGSSGTGKTLLGLHWLMEGASRGEKGLLFGFRESVEQLVRKGLELDTHLGAWIDKGLITIVRQPPTELQIDEACAAIWAAVERTGASRLVIDSMLELEHAILLETRRWGVMASLVETARARAVTTVLTRAVGQVVGPQLDFADSPLELIAENVVLLRYVEYRGELRRIVSVLKMRDSAHDHSIRQYTIGPGGFHVQTRIETSEGLLTGIAKLRSERRGKRTDALGGRGRSRG